MNPLTQWRWWILALLLVGPIVAYVGFGTLWLWERGWVALSVATAIWAITGVVFGVLAAARTRTGQPIMPPLDWDQPHTFTPQDREAWKIVQEEADRGDELTYEALTEGDVYIDTGRRLLNRIARHYHPLAANPLDDVPLLELLTAFELAAEDLARLSRQVPGGDLLTLSHWRKAVQVAGYISKANDLYAILLPFLSPVGGLARWGAREWVVKPAWKSMQQNILRWFYQAFVNRIGVHLIELMSGRLAIGADHYRRLTRRSRTPFSTVPDELKPLTIAVVGARGSGKSRLIAKTREALSGDLTLLRSKLSAMGIDPTPLERLRDAQWVEVPGYTTGTGGESRRDRASRQVAVEASVEADLLIEAVDARSQNHEADAAFAQAWDRWFVEHPQRELPPALVVLTEADRLEAGESWHPPYDWIMAKGPRETAIRSHWEALRKILPPTFSDFVAIGLSEEVPFGVVEQILPALASHVHKAERSALIRRLQEVGGRSKVGRLVRQLGEHGKTLWGSLRHRQKQEAGAGSR